MPRKRTTRATIPSAALRTAYDRKLQRAVSDMSADVTKALLAAYRDEHPRLAQDASPARALRAEMRRMARRWTARFDALAPKLADWFATAARDRVDATMRKAFDDAGWTVRLKLSAAQNDALQSVIGQNVALIKSIPERYLANVEGDVMRAVGVAGNIKPLADSLEKQHGVTARRAAFIALDQNRKANAIMTRARQIELGVTKAIWRHSARPVAPRESHLHFNGKTYDVAKGAFLDGVWTWPGYEISCGCTSEPIIPGFND